MAALTNYAKWDRICDSDDDSPTPEPLAVDVTAAPTIKTRLRKPWAEAARVKTRGAAAWAPFVIDGATYLCVANFFETLLTESGPTQGKPAASTETTSSVFRAVADRGQLVMEEVQQFRSFGAHGVAHIAHGRSHYLCVSMYYSGFVAILKWDGARFEEHQRLDCEGGGGLCAFVVEGQPRLAVAEFQKKGLSLFALVDDSFKSTQYLAADGCCGVTASYINKRTYLIASATWSSITKWRTSSTVFVRSRGDLFAPSFDLEGGEGAATFEWQGRHLCFVATQKDGDGSYCRASPLYEFRRGKYQLVCRVDHAEGAHGACFFKATNGKAYLAIACCGDREKKSFSRKSPVYELDLSADLPLRQVQALDTTGAVAFAAFDVDGRTYLAVANEQGDDPIAGGNVESVVWAVT
jgi:hypothetical protein